MATRCKAARRLPVLNARAGVDIGLLINTGDTSGRYRWRMDHGDQRSTVDYLRRLCPTGGELGNSLGNFLRGRVDATA
eukprot:scaffold8119_cov444-Prasinococcus_capsulatus_cf.AAC.7